VNINCNFCYVVGYCWFIWSWSACGRRFGWSVLMEGWTLPTSSESRPLGRARWGKPLSIINGTFQTFTGNNVNGNLRYNFSWIWHHSQFWRVWMRALITELKCLCPSCLKPFTFSMNKSRYLLVRTRWSKAGAGKASRSHSSTDSLR